MAQGARLDPPTLPTTPLGWVRGLVSQVLRDMVSRDRTIAAPAYTWLVSPHAYATISYLAPDYRPEFVAIRDHWLRWAELGRPREWLEEPSPARPPARVVGDIVACASCGEPFVLRHPSQLYCSTLCGRRAWRSRDKDAINATGGLS